MAFFISDAPTLSDWQMQLGPHALVLGAGTPYTIESIDGLGLPDVRSGDTNRPRTDGEFAGLDLLPGRDITLNLVVSSDGTSLQSALQSLAAALPPIGTTELPLWWKEPDLPLMVTMVRVRKRPRVIDVGYSVGTQTTIALMVHATDPNLYGASQMVQFNSSSGAIGGMGFPTGFPLGFGAGGTVSTATITNPGNRTVFPVFLVEGDCTNPVVQNVTNGGVLEFTIALSSAAGDQIEVDTDTHAISLVNNVTPYPGVNRRSALNAGWSWFGLDPGDNVITFAGGGDMRLFWAPAYVI